jgi:excisionase family DNA binding protein
MTRERSGTAQPTPQEYLTKREAAGYTRHAEPTLDRAKARGELPFYRCGARKVMFRRGDLDKWLGSMRIEILLPAGA